MKSPDGPHRWQGQLFSDLRHPFPTVPELLLAQGRASKSRQYLTAVSADGTEQSLTFGQADRFSARLASWLRAELDIGSGDVVGLAPHNDRASVLAIFALLRTGAVTLLLNPNDPPARQREQTAAAGARAILSIPGHDPLAGSCPLPEPEILPDAPAPAWLPGSGDGAFLIGTSGSTAASKLVLQVHANAAANAAAVVAHHRLAPNDRLLSSLPIHHVNGLHFSLFAMLAAGAHAILIERFDPFAYPGQLARYRPRIASVVPSLLESLLAARAGPQLPDSLAYFVSAAAPLTAATAKRVYHRFGRRICQGYGLTETTNFSCTLPPDLSDHAYARLILEADTPTVGVALAGNAVAILGPDGRPCPLGEQGEICMAGHNVMASYFNNPEATAQAFAHGWFHSQDLGFALKDPEDGRTYFVISGRAKNMAKVGGEAVSLDEVERVLCGLAGVVDAACVAPPDPLYGQRLVAAIVAPDDVSDAAVRAHLANHMSSAAQPNQIVRLEGVPRTATGKILRPDLARILAAIQAS